MTIIRDREWILPSDIPVHHGFPIGLLNEAFGNAESEWVAVWIVRFMKATGDAWRTFTANELLAWLEAEQTRLGRDGPLNPILDVAMGWHTLHGRPRHKGGREGPVYVVRAEATEGKGNELEEITDDFIRRCYLSAARLKNPLLRFCKLLVATAVPS